MVGSWSQSSMGILKEDCNVIVQTSIKVNLLLTVELGHLPVLYIHIILLERKRIRWCFIKRLGMWTGICSLGKFTSWLKKASHMWVAEGHKYTYVCDTFVEFVQRRLLVRSWGSRNEFVLYLERRRGKEDRVTGKGRFKIGEVFKMAAELYCEEVTKAIHPGTQQNECLLCTKNCVRGFEGYGGRITMKLAPKKLLVRSER